MTPTPASDSLRADHRRIETHLDRLLEVLLNLSHGCVGEVRQHFEEIRRLSAPHFAQEEGVFYPRLRSLEPGILAHMDQQHEHTRLTERYLDELLSSFPDPPAERDMIELHRLGIEFHDAVQTHIVDEEDQLLQWADRELSNEEQEQLLQRMRDVVAATSSPAPR
ncbi:MAG: hemerythrin domain-containing protein [Acidobacteria bacterium]|nr:hemerythrin domain-containing protein [Acidobacteriota bacterium]